MQREASPEDGALSKAEQRQQLTGLAGLGVLAHQPAFAAYCKTSEEKRLKITESLLVQKVGSNPKAMKLSYDMKARGNEAKRQQQECQDDQDEGHQAQNLKILVRYAKIAYGATVRWERRRKQ